MRLISLIYILMKYDAFFKLNLQFQNKIASRYAKEAMIYQAKYNREHPHQHIWRHLLYRRTFYFFLDGCHVSVQIEIVRFRYAGSNRTFTFYGSSFCAYSQFSTDFICQALASSNSPDSPVSLSVSRETLDCWKTWVSSGRLPKHEHSSYTTT